MTPNINTFSLTGNSTNTNFTGSSKHNNSIINHINILAFTTKTKTKTKTKSSNSSSSFSMNNNNSNSNINSNNNAKKRQYNLDSNISSSTDISSNEQPKQQDNNISLTEFVRISFRENENEKNGHNNNNINKQQHDVNVNDFDFGFENSIVERCQKRFIPPTQSMLDSYGIPGLVNSVRENDLIHAQKLYDDGLLTCNACNRFGESILHMACRRGHIDMVNFLVNTVGLSITNIKDDYHRTPLHDAFWSSSIHKYNIVNLLLSSGGVDVIELLFCKDKRGYTPLEYARSEDYSKWYSFLYDRKSILRSSLSVTTTTTTTTKKKKNTIQMIGDIVDVVDIVAAAEQQQKQQQKQQHDNNSNKRQRLTHNIIG